MTIKLSVLLFYRRVFPREVTTRLFTLGIYFLAFVSVVLGLGEYLSGSIASFFSAMSESWAIRWEQYAPSNQFQSRNRCSNSNRSIGTFIGCVFQCDLTSLYWDRTSYGLCINLTGFLISTSVLNLCTDVSILILPISVVWKLQIKKSQKIAISGIFLLGGLYVLAFTLNRTRLTFFSSALIASV